MSNEDGRYRNLEAMPHTRVEGIEQSAAENWYIHKWTPVHTAIAQMRAAGRKVKDIAETLDYHPNHVGNILKTPLMKAEIARIQGNYENLLIEADLRLKSLAHRSLDIVEENLGEPKMGVEPVIKDRAELTKEAWRVLNLAMQAKGGGNGGVQVNNVLNIKQVLEDAKAKSDSDLIKDVVAKARESHGQ